MNLAFGKPEESLSPGDMERSQQSIKMTKVLKPFKNARPALLSKCVVDTPDPANLTFLVPTDHCLIPFLSTVQCITNISMAVCRVLSMF